MNDDDKLPIGTLVAIGPDGHEAPIPAADVGYVPSPWRFGHEFPYSLPPAFNQEVVNLCRAKAREAGKLDEFLGAVTMYRPYVTREDALAMLALARVGLDPTSIETVFMLGLQEEHQEANKRDLRILEAVGAMARSAGVMVDRATKGVLFTPSPPLGSMNISFDLAAGGDDTKITPIKKKP